jgi:hypothetical protein
MYEPQLDPEDIPSLTRAFIIRSPSVPVEVRREESGYVLKGAGVLALGTETVGAAGPVRIAALKN